MNIPVYTFTSDKYLRYVQPFAYLFGVYWSTLQPVTIVGYKEPDFSLPPNFTFYSAGEDGGQEHWTDGVIRFLREQPDELAVILLDDYWLCRKADNAGVNTPRYSILIPPFSCPFIAQNISSSLIRDTYGICQLQRRWEHRITTNLQG